MSFVKHRWVKRLALLVCFLFVLATVIVCKAAEDKVIASLGKYESCQAFTSEGFQDYTDYAKYDYKSIFEASTTKRYIENESALR